jgi:hypothetical protein
MRERKTELYARDLVRKFRDSANIIEFVEECMQTAAWMGRFSGRNRFMFQDAVKEELKIEGFDKLIKETWRTRCLL